MPLVIIEQLFLVVDVAGKAFKLKLDLLSEPSSPDELAHQPFPLCFVVIHKEGGELRDLFVDCFKCILAYLRFLIGDSFGEPHNELNKLGRVVDVLNGVNTVCHLHKSLFAALVLFIVDACF